jgi:hypothetical protein
MKNIDGIDGQASRPGKTFFQIKEEIFEILCLRQQEWIRASESDRDAACVRFMNALYVFDSLVYGKLPSNPEFIPARW